MYWLQHGMSESAQDCAFSLEHLRDTVLKVFAVEEGLVFETMPHMIKQVTRNAFGTHFAEDLTDGMNARHIQEQPRGRLPGRQESRVSPGANCLLAKSE